MDQQFGSRRMRAGDLTVNLRRAEHIKGDEFFGFGKADPYAKLSLGDKSRSSKRFQRSSVKQDAGSNPVWDEEFHFHIEHSGLDKCVLYISLYDADVMHDDRLGSLKIDIARVLEENNDKVPYKWYSVYQGLRHKARGKVELALSFVELQDQGDSVPTKTNIDPVFAAATLGVAVGVGQLVTGALAL